MKDVGGLKDILECQTQKLDEQTMVEIEILVNGKRKSVSLKQFKELLFKGEGQKVVKPNGNISDIINNKDYLKKYGVKVLQEFIDYWTELTTNGKRQRWQKEKAFSVNRRLLTWIKRDYNGHYRQHKEYLKQQEDRDYYRKIEEQIDDEKAKEQREKLNEIFNSFGKSNR